MITKPSITAYKILKLSKQALRRGDKFEARKWAMEAVSLIPNNEEPWLILAALATPRASVEYLNRALEINPQSEKAKRGMAWALERKGAKKKPIEIINSIRASAEHAQVNPVKPKKSVFALVTAPLMTVLLVSVLGFSVPYFIPDQVNAQGDQQFAVIAQKETHTLTPTATATFTPTSTPTSTATSTPTNTNTPTPTATYTATATSPPATQTSTPSPVVEAYVPTFSQNGKWIDVNLSQQRITAYQGNTILNSYIVSTGTWAHPTVVGTYQIYLKYDSQTMSGPGYYLPGVPWVMYFYSGYAIHGTYWHDNFGTPMSHGCVNLTIDDAYWMYNFAPLGTWVYVHY